MAIPLLNLSRSMIKRIFWAYLRVLVQVIEGCYVIWRWGIDDLGTAWILESWTVSPYNCIDARQNDKGTCVTDSCRLTHAHRPSKTRLSKLSAMVFILTSVSFQPKVWCFLHHLCGESASTLGEWICTLLLTCCIRNMHLYTRGLQRLSVTEGYDKWRFSVLHHDSTKMVFFMISHDALDTNRRKYTKSQSYIFST